MHFSVLVFVEPAAAETRAKLEVAVEKRLRRHRGKHFDWYEIGGRWTGALDGYRPEADPANIERCDLCGGTGKRSDMEVQDGCNACRGKGRKVKWPTEWVEHAGDAVPVEAVPAAFEPYAIVGDKGWVQSDELRRVGGGAKPKLADFEIVETPLPDWRTLFAGKIAVIVDVHN